MKEMAAQMKDQEGRACLAFSQRWQHTVPSLHTETIVPLLQVVFLSLQYFLYGIFLNPLYVCKVNKESVKCKTRLAGYTFTRFSAF